MYFGLNDQDKNDEWTFEDGRRSAYVNWRAGEPSGGSERCAVMYDDGTWNDVYCDIHYEQYFVCKKPILGNSSSITFRHLSADRRLYIRP